VVWMAGQVNDRRLRFEDRATWVDFGGAHVGKPWAAVRLSRGEDRSISEAPICRSVAGDACNTCVSAGDKYRHTL